MLISFYCILAVLFINNVQDREYASNETGLFEIFSDRVRTYNTTKFTSSLKTGLITIDELENYTKNPLLFKVFRELGWGEELGSGSRNIKKFAPFYYDKSVIEIINQDHFLFSITYNDDRDSVKNKAKDSVNEYTGVTIEATRLTGNELEEKLVTLVEELAVSKAIKKRMVQELKHIYFTEGIDITSLLDLVNYTASQMKGDLRVLTKEGFVVFSAKEKIYLLSSDILSRIKS